MLRHSDRDAMLLDFDKSYSDTRDTTLGGTTNGSDPLPASETPTAQKDIHVIGRLFDIIAENVAGFPAERFNRFRSDCNNDGINIDTLCSDLQAQSKSLLLPGLIIITIALVCIIHALIGRKSTNIVQPIPTTKDTIVTIIENRQLETRSRLPAISHSGIRHLPRKQIRLYILNISCAGIEIIRIIKDAHQFSALDFKFNFPRGHSRGGQLPQIVSGNFHLGSDDRR